MVATNWEKKRETASSGTEQHFKGLLVMVQQLRVIVAPAKDT